MIHPLKLTLILNSDQPVSFSVTEKDAVLMDITNQGRNEYIIILPPNDDQRSIQGVILDQNLDMAIEGVYLTNLEIDLCNHSLGDIIYFEDKNTGEIFVDRFSGFDSNSILKIELPLNLYGFLYNKIEKISLRQ